MKLKPKDFKKRVSSFNIDSDDHALWDIVTADVKPLHKNEHGSSVGVITKTPQLKATFLQPDNNHFKRLLQSNQSKSLKFQHGYAPGLDRRTQMRLRRGQVKIEGRLDLHGLSQKQASEAIMKFIKRAYEAGKKTVLIITGKGTKNASGRGILRSAVPIWLSESHMRTWVHAYDYAAPRDGGEGALYVILRRQR